MATRDALIVAYHYPPVRSAGVERTLQFERYLPDFGYRTRVLTTSTFGGLSDARVLRAWEALSLYRRVWRPGRGQSRDSGDVDRPSWARRMKRWLVPDGQIGWAPAALAAGLRALRREPFDLIYSTSPPASAHLIALALSALSGLPWVADLRDSWVYDPLDPALSDSPSRLELESWLESAVASRADAGITTTDVSATHLKQRHWDARERVTVIANGFDPNDMDSVSEGSFSENLFFDTERAIDGPQRPEFSPRDAEGRRMRMAHTGSFANSHPLRSPDGLLAALELLLRADSSWSDRLELVLAGRLTPREVDRARHLTEAHVVKIIGEVDAATARRIQAESDLLLVIDHHSPWPASNIPGKFFDYLGSGRPVFLLCGEGALANLGEELAMPQPVAPDDEVAIAAAIAGLYERFSSGVLTGVATGTLLRFHRRHLTAALANCFDRVVESRASHAGGHERTNT